ncbi:MAG: LysM domain-containing protein [Pseudomonadales bacterium]
MNTALKCCGVISFGFFILALSACESPGQVPNESSTAVVDEQSEPAIEYVAEQGLSLQQRFKKALGYLEKGEYQQAKAELLAYQVERPKSDIVNDLILQIDMTSNEYYPEEFFEVTLESGESLSTLSKKYQGSVFQFYALAKYNDIASPNDINIGDVVKIPLTSFAKDAVAEASKPADVDDSNENMAQAEEDASEIIHSAESSDPESIVAAIEAQGTVPADQRPKAIEAYLSSANDILSTDPQLASLRYAFAGELLLVSKKPDLALEAYQDSIAADSNNGDAQEAYMQLEKELTDKYHRQASKAFRAQDLDRAIVLWDKVLVIDSEHTNARIYRAQAIELKEKLSALK